MRINNGGRIIPARSAYWSMALGVAGRFGLPKLHELVLAYPRESPTRADDARTQLCTAYTTCLGNVHRAIIYETDGTLPAGSHSSTYRYRGTELSVAYRATLVRSHTCSLSTETAPRSRTRCLTAHFGDVVNSGVVKKCWSDQDLYGVGDTSTGRVHSKR